MLAKYSISAKLVILVSLLLLMTAGLGAVAYTQMRTINTFAQDIQTGWLPSIRWIGEMRVQSARYRAVLRDHLLATDAAQRLDIEKNLAARQADYDNAAKNYDPLISSIAEREMSDELEKLWKGFISAADGVRASSNRGDPAGAREINAKKAVPLGRSMDAALTKMTELNDRGAEASGEKAARVYNDGVRMTLAILVFALLIGACAAIYLVRDIARGIASILKPMSALASGDASVDIPNQHHTTEIGRIAAALQIFQQAMISKNAADEAAGVEAQIKTARADQIGRLTNDFETMIGELVSALASASTELEGSATALTKTSQTAMTLSNSAAGASQSVSKNIQSVAAATEEITSSVNEISRQVHESSRIANNAVAQAQKTDANIARLSSATGKIDHVVKLITAVAEQTNLLALNATIEAARAGEAGRGFAVVASEVKALAAQTARATEEISAQIADMQSASAETVATIREIGATITLMSEASAAIAAAVEQQGAATQEIARSVQQSAELSTQVAREVTDVTQGSRETSFASGQVLDAASSLSMQSERLKGEVKKFLGQVRAA